MPQITCPACSATYDMPAGSIGPDGRKVRCASCKTLWLARAEAVPQPDETIAPDQLCESSAASDSTLHDAPAEQVLAPGHDDVTPPQPGASARHTSALKAPPRQRKPWHERIGERMEAPRARWPLASALLVAACLVAVVGLRKSIVHHIPETGRVFAAIGLPVNLTGLELKSVRSGVFNEGGIELLVVQGEITNVSASNKSVPRLKFAIRDAKGLEIYAWTAQAEMKDLKPGESQSFRRRLASPPPEGADVLVRFAGKADLVALAK